MRTLILSVLLFFCFQTFGQVYVKGYYRKDGTYVKPHYRSNPDGNPYNNWSFPGNTNPYTGKTATGNPSTYLDNYYNRNSKNYSNSYSNRTSSSNYYVSSTSLNVRSGPSTTVIGWLVKSDKVQVVENYTNGWKKVKYTHYDTYSYSYKTKTGYVLGKYLSSYNNSYSSQSSRDFNYDYSTLKNTTYPYGYGKGRLTIWTDCGYDGVIKVLLDGEYIGSLTKYFNSPPACGENGTLSVNKPAGKYKIEAYGNEKVWSGTITITRDRCLIQKLEK